ncbi:tetratricopeptide repeat protein 17 [Calliphora vicina]|uniref:tetratricopeptide repeat protein 17 n=1 Tax=Calliphora vicina TaxID=7373 RepID=UPI00325B9DD9
MWLYILLTIILSQSYNVRSTNHYALKDDGLIKRRLDSPFHLRQPDNLLIFVEQIRNNENAEQAFRKMQRKRSTLDDHIVITDQLLQIILERSKCVRMYVKMTGLSDYLRTTGASMKRLKFPEKLEKEPKGGDPLCREYAELIPARDKYAYLKSFKPDTIKSMSIEREENLLKQELGLKDAESVTATIHEISVKGLVNNPSSWKFHMLGSYYWRLTGHAKNALDCARLSVMLAPEDSKDIPLLSLGTILVRAELWDDAETILNEAIKYGPDHGENYIALATLLALKHDFKSARENFNLAEKLDVSMYNNSLKMRQYIECLEPLDSDATKLFGFVKYMLREIKEVSKLRQEIAQYQNKIIQQQTPLASRFTDNDPQLKADLLKRFQYCSTRKSSENQEPVLFCDFYSDLQMQLESKQFDAELLDWQVNRYISHLFEKFPFEYKKQLEILYNNVKAVAPTRLGVYSM